MPKTEEQMALGQRLRAAARQARISGCRIARRLGVAVPTVYRWWSGQRTPSTAMLLAYAQLVGQPVGYFYGPEGAAAESSQAMGQALLDWARLLMAGEEPEAAFDRVTGEPGALTPRERKQLATAAPRMREELMQATGGDWGLLTEAEQLQVLEQMARLAAPHRAVS